jgi:hypothetical protein
MRLRKVLQELTLVWVRTNFSINIYNNLTLYYPLICTSVWKVGSCLQICMHFSYHPCVLWARLSHLQSASWIKMNQRECVYITHFTHNRVDLPFCVAYFPLVNGPYSGVKNFKLSTLCLKWFLTCIGTNFKDSISLSVVVDPMSRGSVTQCFASELQYLKLFFYIFSVKHCIVLSTFNFSFDYLMTSY